MHRIGVLTGSRLEARCLADEPKFQIACSGADAGWARAGAARLIDEGVEGLVSFGLAGALDPALRPGDLLLPGRVLLGNRAVLEPSCGWRRRVEARLAAAGLTPLGGPLLGSDRLVGSPLGKAELFRETGVVAVDMESHIVGARAAAAGLPWLVLRCVADPADLALPAFIARAVGANGRVRAGVIARGLILDPRALPALFRLAACSRVALAALGRAGRLLAP